VALRENFKTTRRKEEENICSQEYGGIDGEGERGRGSRVGAHILDKLHSENKLT
jgi:hypothetical protein